MPSKLSTIVSTINLIPNQTNAKLVVEFHHYMQFKNCSERHQNNNLQVIIAFANFLGAHIPFYNIERKEHGSSLLRHKEKEPRTRS